MELITTDFERKSTAAEVIKGLNLKGKRAIITGGASGIGIPTAIALASAGAEIILAVRNESAAENVVKDIISASGNPNVRVEPLDVSKRKSIAEFIKKWDGTLDILINNAGVMAIPELQLSEDGWEMQFTTNYMGHFELALGLHGALASAKNSRIVAVSSSGHLLSPVTFDDLHYDFRFYDPLTAYGQSKSAVALFAVGANKRWAKDGITVNALNPGAIATNLQKHTGGLKTPKELQKTPEQGAATSVLLATSPQLEGKGGHYFENCNEAAIVTKRTSDYHGVASYALDQTNADRLWDVSMKLLGY
jgi:NAD(P)-dependent dehydrogenase (short-subunit alcohol dehydrogenase family)